MFYSFLFLFAMLGLSWWAQKNFATIKGRIGEKGISKRLSALNPEKYILLNDLYIPKSDGSTTQIDHVLISHKGLFVIETKNYKGWILGSENSQYWTQVIYKRREKLYNPVWQNANHIKALQEYLGNIIDNIPIYSVVVFGKEATLKFDMPFKRARVIKSKELLRVIKEAPGSDIVSNFKKQKIKEQLASLNIKDKKERKLQSKKHIADIKVNIASQKYQVVKNVCPRCGSQLVNRQGKHGEFKGCSNYPKCRFTST